MPKQFNLRNKVVVVTGASAGIGRATAVEFARHGAKLALIARSERGLADTLQEVQAAGGSGAIYPLDVADAQAVEAAAERIEAELGAIEIWVNNAMATVFAWFHEITPEEYRRATEVTYLGSVWGAMAAYKRMKPRDRGVILQVGSALSYRGIPLQAPYCGAKFALRGFLDSLRSEILAQNSKLRLSMVQLPAHNTPQFDWALSRMPQHPQPLPPIFTPEVAARAIVWTALRQRRETWVAWPSVKAILGARFLPGALLDKYAADQAVEGQMTDEEVRPDRPANLFDPIEGQHRTHGSFSARAKPSSAFFKLTRNRVAVASAVLALILFLIILFWPD